MTEKRSCICFAYFVDNQFVGWYADTFGSVRRNSPKVYPNTEKQIAVITKNFQHKIKTVNEKTSKDVLAEVGSNLLSAKSERETTNARILATVGLMKHDSEDILAGKQVELRIVECPIYDGPNPDFNKEEYTAKSEEYRVRLVAYLKENGVDWEDGPSQRRFILVNKFQEENKRPECNNWIYANYEEVKEWANNEPAVFIGKIQS